MAKYLILPHLQRDFFKSFQVDNPAEPVGGFNEPFIPDEDSLVKPCGWSFNFFISLETTRQDTEKVEKVTV